MVILVKMNILKLYKSIKLSFDGEFGNITENSGISIKKRKRREDVKKPRKSDGYYIVIKIGKTDDVKIKRLKQMIQFDL